ncbi:unnamed protein product [Mycena citricolor]|uniref:Uncharacterized protein n=1 Tax=Mycena citricolor TaxID=2018698 RepID=A0AAD2HW35_9AGAR|nr:unnamed protein product [Mycena citricolor]
MAYGMIGRGFSVGVKALRAGTSTGLLNIMKQCASLWVSTASHASHKSFPQYAQRNQTPWIEDMHLSQTAVVCLRFIKYARASVPGAGPGPRL